MIFYLYPYWIYIPRCRNTKYNPWYQSFGDQLKYKLWKNILQEYRKSIHLDPYIIVMQLYPYVIILQIPA